MLILYLHFTAKRKAICIVEKLYLERRAISVTMTNMVTRVM